MTIASEVGASVGCVVFVLGLRAISPTIRVL